MKTNIMFYITLLMHYKSQCNFENKNSIKLDNEWKTCWNYKINL
jgi:hypothetical protein